MACVRRIFFNVLTPEQVAVLGDALGAVTDHLIAEADPGTMTFLAALRQVCRTTRGSPAHVPVKRSETPPASSSHPVPMPIGPHYGTAAGGAFHW